MSVRALYGGDPSPNVIKVPTVEEFKELTLILLDGSEWKVLDKQYNSAILKYMKGLWFIENDARLFHSWCMVDPSFKEGQSKEEQLDSIFQYYKQYHSKWVSAIKEECEEDGISFVDDSTNSWDSYL